jgi:ABC-type lipoprotein release transport system permease subunit
MGPGRLVNYGSLVRLTTFSPRQEKITSGEFLVVGAFHTGLFEVDLRTVYMPLTAACEFIGLFDETLPDEDGWEVGGWRVSGVGVALDDYDRYKDEVVRRISKDVLPRYYLRLLKWPTSSEIFDPRIQTWEQRKQNLLQAVKIEKGIVSLIIFILIVFVGALIFLILTLNVSEKRRDLGILKAVGAHDRGVVTIFLLHGGTICVIGLALGFLAGLAFTANINQIHDLIHEYTGWQLFPPDIYYIDRIPVAIKIADLLTITGLTVFFGFVGSLLSAIVAVRQDPIKAIRSE